MNATGTRIFKEARSLFWPWCAVTIAGALPLLEQSHSARWGGGFRGIHYLIEPLGFLGFFLGIPLLATLSLGNEFQHRTLQLLLSQPVSRMKIWGEKMSVTAIAVTSSIFVFCYARRSALQQDPKFFMLAGAFVIAMVASATFWTLFARSTIGGVALNCVNSFIPLFIHWERVPSGAIARSIAVLAFLSYAGVMLWLGRRSLARFQVTGGIAGQDLLMAGPEMMPEALARLFRSRPQGAVLNLIRKEFRLLRPLWLISLLAAPVWVVLPLFGYTLQRRSVPAMLMVIAFIPLVAVLAGTISLGEERSSGTHSWHMTLPVSARRQWLIKLVAAMFTGLTCAVLLPIALQIADRFLFGSSLISLNPHDGMLWLLWVMLLTFASFWCACAVRGTVHAALWVFPALIALLFASLFGEWSGRELIDFGVSRLDFFANFRFTNAISNVNWFYWFYSGATLSPSDAFLWGPTLIFAGIQSCRLFHKQLQDSALFVLRRLLPQAVIAFLCSFTLIAFFSLVFQAKRQIWAFFKETHQAIEQIQPGMAKLDATHPPQLTGEDLANASSLSERTRRWLRDSRITVAPDSTHPGDSYCCSENSRGITLSAGQTHSSYLATIHMPNGSTCTVSFQAGSVGGILGGTCQ